MTRRRPRLRPDATKHGFSLRLADRSLGGGRALAQRRQLYDLIANAHTHTHTHVLSTPGSSPEHWLWLRAGAAVRGAASCSQPPSTAAALRPGGVLDAHTGPGTPMAPLTAHCLTPWPNQLPTGHTWAASRRGREGRACFTRLSGAWRGLPRWGRPPASAQRSGEHAFTPGRRGV